MQSETDNVDTDELRKKFLAFFESKGHLIYPSASLRSDDPGLLFNVAGMQQFKPYFQGATPRFPGVEGVWPRVATSQKCLRAGGKDSDIENVGRTRRHHTFFEMLGNFSFGDYFKREAIAWAWEFLTGPDWLGLDPQRLHVTVFTDDDEAYDLWHNEVGVPAERISRWGEAENFWPANAIKNGREGPCGPCSEIFYDRGPGYGSSDETGPNTGMGDRYMEIWNLVFTQFDLQPDGELKPLPQKNIDTGMGFERLTTLVTGARDAYGTGLFQPTIQELVRLSGAPYRDIESIHQRIIADHMRAIVFAIADGILPANDGAGYVIKMLIRRASRQAYLLGLREPVLYRLVECVVRAMGGGYPELKDAQERIRSIVEAEEVQFLRTLQSGIERIDRVLDDLVGDVLPGDLAFDLWETYGFPLDLTVDIAAERGVTVERSGYEAARERAREVSRSNLEKGALFAASQDALSTVAREHGETEFLGYHTGEAQAKVLALVAAGERVPAAEEGASVQVVLDRTPFYAEGGGQVGDAGILEWQGGRAMIGATTRSKEGIYIHGARIVRGTLSDGQSVRAVVDPCRAETQKHHSATHLLHAALRSVLGTHVAQAGSLVAPDRLRFDFSHPQALTEGELQEVQTRVNRWIQADLAVDWRVVPIAEARRSGAMMLFGEKYGENVRMVSMGEAAGASHSQPAVSVELCGGTHVAHTGEIGSFLVTSEEAVSAGVRRIEAVVGMAAVAFVQELKRGTDALARELGVRPDEVPARIERLQADLRTQQREVTTLRDRLAAAQTSGGAAGTAREAAGVRFVTAVLDGLDAGALRNAADSLLGKTGVDLVVLASGQQLVAKTGQAGQAKGLHAGRLIREVAARAGGSGGGRPDMAQAGVKDAGKLQAALDAVAEILEGVRG